MKKRLNILALIVRLFSCTCCKILFLHVQCSPLVLLYLGSIAMDRVISELFIKGQFYKGIIGKLPFHGHFPIIPV